MIDTSTWARSLAFSPDGGRLAAGLFDHTVRLYDRQSGRLSQILSGHTGWVRQVAFASDGAALASVADDGSLRIWKIVDASPTGTLEDGLLGPRALAISPAGDLLAVGMQDGSINLYNLSDLTLLRKLTGHTDWVRCLAFSPDGSLLASGAFDKRVLVWNMPDGRLSLELEGHRASVLSLAFSPDGGLLASASVDQTVRLWRLPGGAALRVLLGHTDFIYSIAFSPDGKTLASTGGDNTLRLWNVEQMTASTAKDPIFPAGEQPPVVDSDCRACHHPRGQVEPPRVVELGCESCHSQGAGLNWCPLFPRSREVQTVIGYTKVSSNAGIPVSAQGLAIEIAAPSNGETLYVNGEYTAPAAVAGRVYAAGGSIDNVVVNLEAWSGDELYTKLSVPAGTDGAFKFSLTINPGGALPVSTAPGERECHLCHDDPLLLGSLPGGEVRLRLTAAASDGSQASDERWFTVDVAKQAALPVQVIDSTSGQALSGLVVQAHTILYEWKDKFAQAETGSNGRAALDLLSLSEADTTYTLTIPPVVLNEVRYASDELVRVTLQPGRPAYPAVTVYASAQRGKIGGTLEGGTLPDTLAGLPVWAVHLPAGPLYQAELDQDHRFIFDLFPVGQYLVFPDALQLAREKLAAPAQQSDLFESPEMNLTFDLAGETALFGNVGQDGDLRLPFAWLSIDDRPIAYPVSPVSGAFLLQNLPDTPFVITASAPGFYSISQRVNSLVAALDLALEPRPDARQIAWGKGAITLPAETSATVDEAHIALTQGWLWGDSAGASQPLTLQTLAGTIELADGQFAVEAPPEGLSWLYVYRGSAAVTLGSAQSSIEIHAGQMIALRGEAQPMAMQDAVALALHPALQQPPVSMEFDPGLRARIQNGLAQAGIGLAQTITLAAYIFSLVVLVTLPLLALIFLFKRRRRKIDSNHQERHE